MVFIKRASYLLICLLLPSLAIFAKKKDYFDDVDRIQGQFIREMEQTYGWVCVGDGGSMPDKVRSISVQFAIPRRATIEEARALEVMATERFSEMVNADEKIRPYLCEFPFPPQRTEVSLSFYTPLGNPPSDGSVAFLFHAKEKLFYCSFDPMTKQSFVDIFQEPYLDAKQIVASSPKLNPFAHEQKPYEAPIDATFDVYATEMFKKHKLGCQNISEKIKDGIIEEVFVELIYFHATKMDKARELQVVATEKLLEAINSNEKLRPYLKNYPFSPNQLKVTVLFRKSNYYPYFDGTLDSVHQSGDEVTYLNQHYFDKNAESQSFPRELPVFAKESYQECVTKVRNSSRGKKLNIKWQSL